jgi:hypothetical protein
MNDITVGVCIHWSGLWWLAGISGCHTRYATLIRRVRLRNKLTVLAGTFIRSYINGLALGGSVAVKYIICVLHRVSWPSRCIIGRNLGDVFSII